MIFASALAALTISIGSRGTAQSSVTLITLRAEYRTNPLGADAVAPRLSWQLQSSVRGTMQSAYELQVATDSADLVAGRRLAWDSGRLADANSLFRPYSGPAGSSRTRYYWRVRVWDARGSPSSWSAVSWWENGLLARDDWSAQWIRPPASAHDSSGAPSPMLRRTFSVNGRVRSARAYVTALGLYELHLNGHRVGDDLFTPGYTSYGKRLQYQTYDVTSLLAPGVNAVGAILGDGWYRGYLGFANRKNIYGTRVAALVQLEIRYADGRVERILSDSGWKSSTGAIRYSDIYHGERYDARLEPGVWDTGRFDDHGWQSVEVAPQYAGTLVSPVTEPVRRTRRVKPIAILMSPKGYPIVDLGQNITGWVQLRVRGTAGRTITLRHAEVLDQGDIYMANLREADQTDRYTLKGGGEEIYEPHFTYHGFRYVAVEGLESAPSLETVTGIVVHSDLVETGTFVTSDSMINKLQQNILWGQRGNFLDVPTDCPQRNERLGWTGDAQVFARTAAFNMNVAGFFAKWLADLAADQHAGGAVPWVIPNPLGGDSVRFASAAGWADASTVVPWTMYLMYGDRAVLERQFASMRAWVDYAHRQAGPGLVWRNGEHFGDWLAWHSDDASYPGATTGKDFIATAYLAHSADLVARAAAVLGRTDDARRYRSLFMQVRDSFRKEFVSANGRVAENTQTAYALALNFGLLSAEEQNGAADRIVADIHRHGGHLSTGFLGTPELTHALSQHGHLAAAYGLLMQRTYPSWLYPITRGATTMWERWDGIRPDGSFEDVTMNSFNHYAFGAIGDWMYRTIGGIDIDPAAPGYQHVLIAPRPGGGLTSARTALQTGYGLLVTDWHLIDGELSLAVTLPANTTATVTLSGANAATVTENGATLNAAAGVRSVAQRGNELVLEIGSGAFTFRTRLHE